MCIYIYIYRAIIGSSHSPLAAADKYMRAYTRVAFHSCRKDFLTTRKSPQKEITINIRENYSPQLCVCAELKTVNFSPFLSKLFDKKCKLLSCLNNNAIYCIYKTGKRISQPDQFELRIIRVESKPTNSVNNRQLDRYEIARGNQFGI